MEETFAELYDILCKNVFLYARAVKFSLRISVKCYVTTALLVICRMIGEIK